MEDKVVLVTGSSAGIGEATALSFARLGCRLVVHGTDGTRLKQVAKKCYETSPKRYMPLEVIGDLREAEHVARLLSETIDTYGKLDVLVNNAGLFQPVAIDEPNAYETFTDLMKINLNAVVLLTTLAVPHLRKSNGCIVNISSNLHKKCMAGGFAYSTAKAALTMFTKSIAVDLAPNIRVNSVSPGPIATLMPTRCGVDVDTYRKVVGQDCLVGRVGEPEEVARVVLFLASPDAAFITGTDIIIDGGSTIKPAGKLMSQA